MAEDCYTVCHLSVALLLAQQAHVDTQVVRMSSVRLGNRVTSHMRTFELEWPELVVDMQKARLVNLLQAVEAAVAVLKTHSPRVAETGKALAVGPAEASTFDDHCWSVSWKDMFVPGTVWDV